MNGERGRRTRESSFEGDKERKGSGRIRGYEGKEKERHEASTRQEMVKSKPGIHRAVQIEADSTDALPLQHRTTSAKMHWSNHFLCLYALH